MAAQVAAKAPPLEGQDDEVATGQVPGEASDASDNAKGPSAEDQFKAIYGEDALKVAIETDSGGGLDVSASRRLATVRALNADKAPQAPAAPAAPANGTNNGAGAAPQPIEDQIDTVMTQTLQTLSKRPPPTAYNEDDDDDDTKSGFFSRFKRS